MGERYNKWLQDKNSLQILQGFKFDDLDEELQERLEKIYEMGQDRYDTSKGQKAVKDLAKLLNTSVQSIKDTVRYLENLSYPLSVRGGQDSSVYEGDQHRRGMSHNQSIQDNNS